MSPLPCTAFRTELEGVLRGRPSPGRLTELSWNEHLLGCAACRSLLEAEEALESLLASMPEPKLPPELARRVLARLRAASAEAAGHADPEGRLDALLGADPGEPVPEDLPGRLLDRLQAERAAARRRAHRRLWRLLGSVPAPSAPEGLPERVLAGLEAQRGRVRGTPAPTPAARAPVPAWLVPLAAALLVTALAAWGLWRTLADPGSREAVAEVEPTPSQARTFPEGEPVAPTLSPGSGDPGGAAGPEAGGPGQPPVDPVDPVDPVGPFEPGESGESGPEPQEDLLAHLELLADDWELVMNEQDLDALLGSLSAEDQLWLGALAGPAEVGLPEELEVDSPEADSNG